MTFTPARAGKPILQENPEPLPALAALFQSLNRQGIRYCHWKSNIRLEEALQGKTDLDLLVDTEHIQKFKQVLQDHGARLFQPAPGKEYPGIENYLGFDPDTGRLYHLHVHYQLVLGEQFVKNYHLPLEAPFLDSTRLRQGVMIPAPELEIAVLSLRALLKYRDRDAVKDILSIRSSGLPGNILREINWLLQQTSLQEISQAMEEIPGAFPSELVQEFLQTVVVEPRAGRTFLRLRGEIRRALNTYQRQDRVAASLRYFREAWRRRTILRRSPARKMTLPGGFEIAVVGVDGAGKSTVIAHLAKWLSWRLSVRTIYMGSSQPSVFTSLVKGVSKLAGRLHTGVSRLFGKRSPAAGLSASLYTLLASLRYLSEGRDRYQRFQAGRSAVQEGMIVIYDRYPLENARIFNRTVDGPRIASLETGKASRIIKKLSRVEQELYRKIQPPQHLVILHVSPEVSQARKPEHKREQIEAKSQAMESISAAVSTLNGGTHSGENGRAPGSSDQLVIDTDQPLEKVVLLVKSAVWRWL
jgi:thymidylate kinase